MLLGLSGEASNQEVALGVVGGSQRGDAGVPHGELLVRLCEAMVAEDREAVAAVRSEMVAAMNEAAFVDAVGVSSLFHLMNRVANATGTPIDAFLLAPVSQIVEAIGADAFESSKDTLLP
ncbi:MAG: hypothetical protein P8Q97_01275 [Myxococcota bacterium]|nr:hypothetical protein [Myxococcota bacterium]